MRIYNYLAVVHKDDTSDYGVSFPDFPGCVTAGGILAEAVDKAKEALSLHVRGMLTEGLSFPTPSALDKDDLLLQGLETVLQVPVLLSGLEWASRIFPSILNAPEWEVPAPLTRAAAIQRVLEMRGFLDQVGWVYPVEAVWIPLDDGGFTLEFENDFLDRSFVLIWDDSNSANEIYFMSQLDRYYRTGVIMDDEAFLSLCSWLVGRCELDEVAGVTLARR